MDCSTPGFPVYPQLPRSLHKLISNKLVMPSNHLILCHPLLLLLSVFPSIQVFSNKSVLHIKWPNSTCQNLPFSWVSSILTTMSKKMVCYTFALLFLIKQLCFTLISHVTCIKTDYTQRYKVNLCEVKGKVAQPCLMLCNPMDCIVHGIPQARMDSLSLLQGSSQPRDRTQVSRTAGDSLPAEPQRKPFIQ